MDCSTPGFSVHHQLLEPTQTHVHWIGDAIQPSCPLSFPSPPAWNLSQHQSLFQWVKVLCIKWPEYWSFSFSISPSSEYSEPISFRIDWFDFLAVQGTVTSSPAPQFESISSALNLPYSLTLTSVHDYWKNHSFDYRDFFGKVLSLLFNTLSRCGIPFLSRNKCLLISWLQVPSKVILEPKKIKSATASTFFPYICHEVMGPDTMILVFLLLSFKPAIFHKASLKWNVKEK